MKIRVVHSYEAQLISELAIRSKAHWGYDEKFMNSCVEELSHSEEEILDDSFLYYLAEENGDLLGFYKLENLNGDTVLLEALFIDPAAEPFYIAMGAKVTGRKESGSISGRFLPMIKIQLVSAA